MLSILLNLLPSGLGARVGLGALVLALSAAGGGWLGYRLGHAGLADARADCAEQRAATLAETADALALLAARIAAAEAKYAQERARKNRVIERHVEIVRREIDRLPDRGCPVEPRARRLLVDALCAHPRNAARPECVPGDLPGASDAARSRPAGTEPQSLDRRAYPVG